MSTTPTILVTGGCGYIGSHTIIDLLNKNYDVVVVDNLCNSSPKSLDRVAQIVGLSDEERKTRLKFYNVDICNEKELRKVFEEENTFNGCIHFAGLKAVGESTRIPLLYYENNLIGTFCLLKLMDEYGCHSIVFSSSATVYGAAEVPITEDSTVGMGITNAYGRTKYMIEEILHDFYLSKNLDKSKPNDWSVVILRYFNPVGAHQTGLIGEDPHGIPNNLMPYVSQVAIGRRPHLTVFGNDYPTPDGTGVRDYLHVMDLADGHLAAMEYIRAHKRDLEDSNNKDRYGYRVFNLGTGHGSSVLEMVKAMSKACGHEVKYEIGERRPGDIAVCYADAARAKTELNWEAKRGLDEMCQDLWKWQTTNPNGYVDDDK